MAAPATPDRIAHAWRELRRGAAGTQLRRTLLGPGGPPLEQAQMDALEILAGEPGGLRMSDFADAMHVDPSTATRAVDRLERLGLVTRSPAEDDRRFVRARLTGDGTRMVNRIAKLRRSGIERLLESFDDDERDQFADYLERFVEAIDRLAGELGRRTDDADVDRARQRPPASR